MASCSKAPWGLFVLLWVTRIFTGLSISPGPSLRQCPDRYAFRAGRNLPDKEFRYLRTVIVTAAVYWGFGSELAPLPLTFQHWAGISRYTSLTFWHRPKFLLNSRLGHFSAPPTRFTRASPFTARGSLLPKLRDQFAEFLNEGSPVHLGIFYQPTCVGLRYGRLVLARGFSWQLDSIALRSPEGKLPFVLGFPYGAGGFAYQLPTSLKSLANSRPILLRPPIAHNGLQWYRNINLLSIGYASGTP